LYGDDWESSNDDDVADKLPSISAKLPNTQFAPSSVQEELAPTTSTKVTIQLTKPKPQTTAADPKKRDMKTDGKVKELESNLTKKYGKAL
jgi:hypothetical protein